MGPSPKAPRLRELRLRRLAVLYAPVLGAGVWLSLRHGVASAGFESLEEADWLHPSVWSEEAEHAFAKARRMAGKEDRRCRLRGDGVGLKSFDEEIGLRALTQIDEGVQIVPISRIVGSVAKPWAFTRTFNPRSDDMRGRWKRAYAAMHGLHGYNPIDLYRFEDEFFVEDGHFRVSALKAVGGRTIEASIKGWVASVSTTVKGSVQERLLVTGSGRRSRRG